MLTLELGKASMGNLSCKAGSLLGFEDIVVGCLDSGSVLDELLLIVFREGRVTYPSAGIVEPANSLESLKSGSWVRKRACNQ